VEHGGTGAACPLPVPDGVAGARRAGWRVAEKIWAARRYSHAVGHLWGKRRILRRGGCLVRSPRQRPGSPTWSGTGSSEPWDSPGRADGLDEVLDMRILDHTAVRALPLRFLNWLRVGEPARPVAGLRCAAHPRSHRAKWTFHVEQATPRADAHLWQAEHRHGGRCSTWNTRSRLLHTPRGTWLDRSHPAGGAGAALCTYI
jgi:hypothetical protein